MIRRDFILRMIEQCIQALTRSLRLSRAGQFDEAQAELDQGIRALTGLDAKRVGQLSNAELMAALLEGGPTQFVRQKGMLLSALLQRTADAHLAQNRPAEARACLLQALNLQLTVLNQEGAFDYPEFVPKVDALVTALNGEALPLSTSAALMQHYEAIGNFAKAEDVLFSILDAGPFNEHAFAFGRQFYLRLQGKTNEALELGNLPRNEVEAGLEELSQRGRSQRG